MTGFGFRFGPFTEMRTRIGTFIKKTSIRFDHVICSASSDRYASNALHFCTQSSGLPQNTSRQLEVIIPRCRAWKCIIIFSFWTDPCLILSPPNDPHRRLTVIFFYPWIPPQKRVRDKSIVHCGLNVSGRFRLAFPEERKKMTRFARGLNSRPCSWRCGGGGYRGIVLITYEWH